MKIIKALRIMMCVPIIFFEIILLLIVRDYYTEKNIIGIILAIILVVISSVIIYFLIPKRKTSKKIDTISSEINSKDIILGAQDSNNLYEETVNLPKKNISKVEPLETNNNNSESIEKVKSDWFETYVTGLEYEGRNKILSNVIRNLIKEDYYFEYYEGYKNKDILKEYEEDYYYNEYQVKIWQLNNEYLPYINLLPEPENEYDQYAVSVLVGNEVDEMKKIGYIPKRDSKKVFELIRTNRVIEVNGMIKGGKYKTIVDNEGDSEKLYKVVIEETDYYIDISIKYRD